MKGWTEADMKKIAARCGALLTHAELASAAAILPIRPSELLTYFRERAGMTKTALAKAVDCRLDWIRKLEGTHQSGTYYHDVAEIDILSGVLDCSLFEREVWRVSAVLNRGLDVRVIAHSVDDALLLQDLAGNWRYELEKAGKYGSFSC